MPGLQTHLLWSGVDSAEVDRQLDRAKEAGAEIVRVDVGWASIEPDGKGKYSNWHLARLDGVVDKARARGIKVLVTFWETPCWASSAPEELKQGCAGSWWGRGVQRYAPTNPADYADALAFVAKRYGDRVEAYEVWNEPNQDYYFKAADPIRAYADMVKATYPVVKRAEPGATVIAGSLADADFGFTEKLYDQGIKGSFDAWSIHPYSGDKSPLDLADDAWIKTSFVRGVPAVRETMLRHGDDKPLWLTELGYSTCTVRSREKWQSCVDESTQAAYLLEAYRTMRSWDYVEAGIWFNVKDTSADVGDRVDNYGLLKNDGSKKPAFAAFQTAAAELAAGATVPAGTSGAATGSTPATATGSSTSATTPTSGSTDTAPSTAGPTPATTSTSSPAPATTSGSAPATTSAAAPTSTSSPAPATTSGSTAAPTGTSGTTTRTTAEPVYVEGAKAIEAAVNATPSAASAPAGEAPAASQVGTPKARTKLGRVKLKVSRKRTKLVAKGSARGRTSVRVQAFRYDEENGEFDSSAAYTATVAVDAAGRFSQTFRATALRQGTWRFSVVAEGDADSSTASSRVS